MKLLIVDDEQHVIKAIKFLINATTLHISTILEASCVQDAISIIRAEQPELIITDVVMDDFTGIDLMEYLKSQDLPAKVIVVSGYNEYNYIRSTLQNGGIDYLLKPIDGSQLNAALEKAIAAWEEEQKNSSMCDICKESLLYKLITQPDQEKHYGEFIRILPALEREHSVILGYASLKYWGVERDHECCRHFRRLHEDINDMLEGHGYGFCFSPPDSDFEYYIFLYKNHDTAIAGIQRLLEETQSRFRIPFSIGISLVGVFPSKARTLKEQAEQAFLSQDVCTPYGSLIPYAPQEPQPGLPSLTREEDQMFSALITGNEPVIDTYVDAFIKKAFPGSRYPLSYLAGFTEHYNSFMKQWTKRLNEYYTHTRFTDCLPLRCALLLDEDYGFSLLQLRRQIKEDIRHFGKELTAGGSGQEHDTIYQIAHYIELNYTKPYNQVEYARLFFINKDYMCRKFKSTFHINMVSYITQLRLNKAKELLASSDMKIRDIAQAVGFDDEKYFSRRFGREIGMSPNEYRQTHGFMDG